MLAHVFEVASVTPQVYIRTGKALRTVQWGKDVYLAGNFSIMDNQTVIIPEGTWYNYFKQEQQTEMSLTLAPGELLILTAKSLELPKIDSANDETAVENILENNCSHLQPPYNVQVYTLSGQMIERQVNVMQADLSGLKSGLYILQYNNNGQKIAKKVIR